MGRLKDLTGMTFGRWKVIERAGTNKHGKVVWLCECSCENHTLKKVTANSLLSGHSKSCGCLGRESSKIRHTIHGGKGTKIYNIWQAIKTRVTNPNAHNYKNYGGRGIKICEEWLDFNNFYNWAMNNGYKDGLSIERKDVNGNYCPENCCWITIEEQRLNKRKCSSHFIEFEGQRKTIKEWAKQKNINYMTLFTRICYLNWEIGKALNTPPTRRRKDED